MKSIFAAAGLLLAASAIPATAIAQDSVQSDSIVVTAQNQKDWNEGSKLEAQGLKDLEKAKAKLIDSSADVVNAQNKRDSSLARSENAASEFRNLTANIPYFSDGTAAKQWADQVRKMADEWAKYSDRHGDGSNDFEKSSKAQIKAQAAVDKAQAKIDRGRTMKAEAERMSRVTLTN